MVTKKGLVALLVSFACLSFFACSDGSSSDDETAGDSGSPITVTVEN